jgi:hypothetical protein
MPDEPLWARLVRRYEFQPALKALLQLVPMAAAFDSGLLAMFRQYEAERLRVFFDELGSGAIELTTATIESEDFLHCYFQTLRAPFGRVAGRRSGVWPGF